MRNQFSFSELACSAVLAQASLISFLSSPLTQFCRGTITKSLHQEIAHILPLQVTFPFGIVYTIFIITAMRGIQEPLTQPQLVPVAYLMDKWTGISGSLLCNRLLPIRCFSLYVLHRSLSLAFPPLK